MTQPPNGEPRYRLLTGPDDAHFCRRVSDALDAGYALHGSPAATHDGNQVIVAQAVVWQGPESTPVQAAVAHELEAMEDELKSGE
ncbi:DUF1737 domain-containing protein [Amycolatopsis sp. NPDC059027]|uniref:DUF1737 domain-containing protein n=1 Tax=unclassified Amycolatopsis TaxID=2618356 RepID=UPI00366CADD8